MSRHTPASVDAWYSPGCTTRYSVSLCDEDGSEIRCLGGDDDIEAAWEHACEVADEYGIPARLLPRETSEVTREYQPGSEAQS